MESIEFNNQDGYEDTNNSSLVSNMMMVKSQNSN
jgi:hypothetical protein